MRVNSRWFQPATWRRTSPPKIKGTPRPLGLRQNALWTFCGEGAYGFSQLCILIVLARLGSVALVGQYAWALAVTTPIFLFFSLQLRTILAATPNSAAVFGTFVRARLITTAIAASSVILLASFLDSPMALIVAGIGLAKAIDSLSDVLYGLFWQQNRMDLIARSMILRSIGSLTCFTLTLYLTNSLILCVFTTAGAFSLVLVLHDSLVAYTTQFGVLKDTFVTEFRNRSWLTLIFIGLPAGMLSCLASLEVYIPRYFLEASIGVEALGIFTALASIFIGFELIARSFNNAAIPRLSQFLQENSIGCLNKLLVRLFLIGLVLALGLLVGTLLLGRPLITLIFGASYGQHFNTLLFLMIASTLRLLALPLSMSLRAFKAYRLLAANQILATSALIASCFLLVPEYQLAGCAVSIIIAITVDIIGRCFLHVLLLKNQTKLINQSYHSAMAA